MYTVEIQCFKELSNYKDSNLKVRGVKRTLTSPIKIGSFSRRFSMSNTDVQISNEIYVINNDDKESPVYPDILNPISNREQSFRALQNKNAPLVTIYFLARNNLEKYTKPAIEALLEYTSHIDFEIILVDNASTDDTLEYFKTINFRRKKIVRITKHTGALITAQIIERTVGVSGLGKYWIYFPNDILVTKNWLDNLLRCMESDERIGEVVPVSDYTSNQQLVDLHYTDLEDMQRKAEAFNVSDPRKWEERIRVMPTVCMVRSHLVNLFPDDSAFTWYFADDDGSFKLRRLGYKLILCGDTFVHHAGSTMSTEMMNKALAEGRQIFFRKYLVDAWTDTWNFEFPMCNLLLSSHLQNPNPEKEHRIFGIDVRCGQPILTIKNILRRYGVDNVHLSAYTHDPRYWLDLTTICDGEVVCNQFPENLKNTFTEIILGQHLNAYPNPLMFINTILPYLASNGNFVFKYYNFNTPEYKAISFKDIKQHVDSKHSYRIMNVSKNLLDNKEAIEAWRNLKENANKGDKNAKKILKRDFSDCETFGEYSVGEVIVVVNRVK